MARDGNGVFDHERLWAAIDAVAAINGLSPSALARRSGLNATSFNKSKRRGQDGRLRWPSTESIAKILEATGLQLETFMALVSRDGPDRLPAPGTVPLLGPEAVGAIGFLDESSPGPDAEADSVAFPPTSRGDLFAIVVADDSMLPIYRRGDTLILSRAADLRRGDRIVLAPVDGRLSAQLFCRRTTRFLEVSDMTDVSRTMSHPIGTIRWQARILWASQ